MAYDEAAAKRARAAIDVYAWSYDRYVTQRKYGAHAAVQLAGADATVRSVAARFERPWGDVATFLPHAFAVQHAGRSVARWSYVHAASLQPSPELTLFEYMQVRVVWVQAGGGACKSFLSKGGSFASPFLLKGGSATPCGPSF